MGTAQTLRLPKPSGIAEAKGAQKGAAKNRRSIQIALLVIGILDLALVAMILRPPAASVSDRQTKFEQSRSQYDLTLATVKQMRELKAKLQSAIHNDATFADGHFLRRRAAFSSMVSNLEALAVKNRLRPSTVTYSLKDNKEQPSYVEVTVKMTVDGGYTDLIEFVNNLEKSDLFWLIDNVQVNSATGNNLRMMLSMQTIAALPEEKSQL